MNNGRRLVIGIPHYICREEAAEWKICNLLYQLLWCQSRLESDIFFCFTSCYYFFYTRLSTICTLCTNLRVISSLIAFTFFLVILLYIIVYSMTFVAVNQQNLLNLPVISLSLGRDIYLVFSSLFCYIFLRDDFSYCFHYCLFFLNHFTTSKDGIQLVREG